MEVSKLIGLLFGAVLLLVACASPRLSYGPVEKIETDTGYYPANWVELDKDRLLVLTMSGGGKRAAAFAQGMLDALAAIPHRDATLIDNVALVSSVSGGSATAANFVLNGKESFKAFRDEFLYINLTPRLVTDALTNPPIPWSLVVENNRIESAVRMLENTFIPAEATYADIPASSPYWIANATDIASLQTFPFTQYQFDILCADLDEFPISRAVAASSAFPVALSSIVLKNDAPCPAQEIRGPDEIHKALDYLTVHYAGDKPYYRGDSSYLLERFRDSLDQLDLCDGEDGCTRPSYVHLFDGGIADNLGLSEPLYLLSFSFSAGIPMAAFQKDGALKRVTLLTANAASSSDTIIGETSNTPNIATTLRSVIDAGIDRRSIGLTAQTSVLQEVLAGNPPEGAQRPAGVAAALSFQRIADPICRRRFSNLPTDWGLEQHEVSATVILGAALTFGTQAIREHASPGFESIQTWDNIGQCLMERACECITNESQCERVEPDILTSTGCAPVN